MASTTSTTPQIVGAVIESGRLYKAGDEADFATAMQGKSVAHLIEKGVIVGDWDTAPSASDAAPDANTDAAAAQTSTPAAKKHSRRTSKGG